MSAARQSINPESRGEALAGARSIVVKIGSAVLTGGRGRIDDVYLRKIAAALSNAAEAGKRIIIVSSGAVSAGQGELKLKCRPTDISVLQATAAAGQPLLMMKWHDALAATGARVAQMLLTRSDFDNRERFVNIRNCAAALAELGAIAIVNENDTVATEEISLGDNDVLAAKLAVAVGAEALIMLTTVDGVTDENGQVIEQCRDAFELVGHVRAERSGQGRGGMETKVEAARIATQGGIPVVIAPGRPPGVVRKILDGARIGTFVPAIGSRHRGRRQWIATTATPVGTVELDDGAADAVSQRNASLLAKGVTSCIGRFDVGDVVSLVDRRGTHIGRGLINVSAEELRSVMGRESSEFEQILGRRAHEEVIHRDNLVLSD